MDSAPDHARACGARRQKMSTATIPVGQMVLSANRCRADLTPRWLLLGTGFIVAVAFFVAGHDLRVSLAEAYTQNAEEMELAASGGNGLRRVAFVAVGGWGCLLLAVARTSLRINPLLASGIGLLIG